MIIFKYLKTATRIRYFCLGPEKQSLILQVDNFMAGIPRTGITPLALLEEAMTDRMEMAYMLVRIFLGKGKIEGLLSMLFTLEAKKSTPETIFRG